MKGKLSWSTTLRNRPMVGRAHESAMLLYQFELACTGTTRVALLAGEPGIGKTRLLDWLGEQAAERGAAVLRGGTFQAEGMPPYLPLLEALGRYVREAEPNTLRKQLGPTANTLSALLPELAAILGDLPAGYSLPLEQARLRLFEAVGAFLAAIAADDPLVLLLDDLQWCDSSTLELICYVTRTQSRSNLLMAGAYRADEAVANPALQRTIAELVRQRCLTTVRIAPLALEEIEAMAKQYLDAPVESPLTWILHRQSEGNPFFVEELLQAWLEMGSVMRSGQGWTVVRGTEVPPSSIVAAIEQRLDRLHPHTVDQLRVAAIMGRTFDISLFAAVVGEDPETVEEGLREAQSAHILEAGGNLFSFRHDMFRECLYANVSATRRQRLHQVIGLALEERQRRGGDARIADLAYHFARGTDRERGIAYTRLAGDEALQHLAIEEAVQQYGTALQLLGPGDERRGKVLLQLGQAALLAGKEDLAAESFEAAQSLLKERDPTGAGQAAHGLGTAKWRQDKVLEARLAFEAALTLLNPEEGPEAVRASVDLATLLAVDFGRQEEGMERGRQAMKLADRLKDAKLQAAATRAAGNLSMRGNQIAEGLRLLERALVLARAADDPAEAAESCANLANGYYWQGDINRSREYTLLRQELAQRCHQPFEMRHVHSWLAFLAATQDNWDEADRLLTRARPVVEGFASNEPLAFFHQIQGFLRWEMGDFASAERAFRAASELFREHSPGQLTWYLGLLGLAQFALGKQRDGERTLEELEGLIQALPIGTLPTAPALNCALLMAVRTGDRLRATHYYPQLQAFHGQLHWFLIDHTLARCAVMIGNQEDARGYLDTAEQAARHARMQTVLHAIQHDRALLDGNARTDALPAGVSRREADVLRLVAAGMSNREIAQQLHLSENTVAKHLTSIFNKTASDNRAAAVAFAAQHGLIR